MPVKKANTKRINHKATSGTKKQAAIANETDYNTVMTKIDELMAKGSKNVSKSELSEIRQLALLAQEYEQKKYVIELPSHLQA